MIKLRQCLMILFCLGASCSAPCNALAEGADALRITKGINLSNWLANAARQPVNARDFQLIRRAGFDHVRIPFNPERYGFKLAVSSHSANDVRLGQLDDAIALAAKNGLAVILDLHPPGAFMKELEHDSWAEKEFSELWVALAEHYKTRPASELAFELLNEPQYYHKEAQYNALMKTLVAAIRKIDPARILIIGAPHGSSVGGLQTLEPVADANVIYAFHFYEPYMVTHQGVRQGFNGLMQRHFHGMPYPSELTAGSAQSYAPGAPDPAQAQKELAQYRDQKWDLNHLEERIRLAKDWGMRNHARLICSEFGVNRDGTDAASRYRWIADMRKTLESGGIAWELWDYTDLFGITELSGPTSTDPVDGSVRLVNPAKGARRIEPAAIQALGLHD